MADGKLMAYTDGVLGGPAGGAMPGALMAYQDGSLGQYEQAAAGVQGFGQFDGPLQAYRDGIVGGPPGGPMPGQDSAYKDGILGKLRGVGEYFAGVGEYFSGVGQDMVMPEETIVAQAPPVTTASAGPSRAMLFGIGAIALIGVYYVMKNKPTRSYSPNRRRKRRKHRANRRRARS